MLLMFYYTVGNHCSLNSNFEKITVIKSLVLFISSLTIGFYCFQNNITI